MSNPKTTTKEEVLAFLEDLDSFTPSSAKVKSTPPSSATTKSPPQVPGESSTVQKSSIASVAKGARSSEDILNFLDEITASGQPKPSSSSVKTAYTPKSNLGPAVGVAPPSTASAKSVPSVVRAPGPSSTNRVESVPSSTSNTGPPINPNSQTSDGLLTQQPTSSEPENKGDSWSWLWSTAAQATAKGISTAKAVAEQVSSNEIVKEISATVTPEIGRLKNDFTKIANNLADTLAPHERDGLDSNGLYAATLTVWFCVDSVVLSVQELESMQEFVQSTVNEMCSKSFQAAGTSPEVSQPLCHQAVVHFVKDNVSVVSSTLEKAWDRTIETRKRLQKLVEASPEKSQHAGPGTLFDADGDIPDNTPDQAIFLTLQPFSEHVPAGHPHTQYLCTISSPLSQPTTAQIVETRDSFTFSISQSISSRAASMVPPSEMNLPKREGLNANVWKQWESTQHRRVMETVIADVIEEWVVSLR